MVLNPLGEENERALAPDVDPPTTQVEIVLTSNETYRLFLKMILDIPRQPFNSAKVVMTVSKYKLSFVPQSMQDAEIMPY